MDRFDIMTNKEKELEEAEDESVEQEPITLDIHDSFLGPKSVFLEGD